jgi:hypothetical protein
MLWVRSVAAAAEGFWVFMLTQPAGEHGSAGAALKPVDESQVTEMAIGDVLQCGAGRAVDGFLFRQICSPNDDA